MRVAYFFAEVLVMWLLLLALGALAIWGARGFDPLGQLFLLGYTIVAFGGSVKLVLVGNGERSIWTGFYRPVRILAMVLPGIAAFRRDSSLPGFGMRKTFAFDFRGRAGVTSYDVVDALSAKLSAVGIAHDKAGGLLVEDNGTTWWVEPEIGADRLTGWVESPDRANRTQIVDGIRDFLERDMRLQVT